MYRRSCSGNTYSNIIIFNSIERKRILITKTNNDLVVYISQKLAFYSFFTVRTTNEDEIKINLENSISEKSLVE